MHAPIIPAMSTDDLPPLPAVPVGRYRHYKGNLYELVGAVRHSETLEPLALYRPLYGEGALWVRPWAMFFETVVVDGVSQPRFARIDQAGSSS
jgi:hypothetical protein